MPLTPDDLRTVAELLGSAPSVREATAAWRSRTPAQRVLVVDAFDMRDETPALRVGGRAAYLATSNGHCWSVTQQPQAADALILTED
jgi:DNA-binding IclR family transcriptional regulator